MKKLLVFIFLIINVISLNYFQPHFLTDIFSDYISKVYIYQNSIVDNLPQFSTLNGCGQILKMNVKDFRNNKHKITNIAGESIVLNCELSIERIKEILNLDIVESCGYNDGVLLTGYTTKLNNYLYLGVNKVNVQIYCTGNTQMLGYPLIMQGF